MLLKMSDGGDLIRVQLFDLQFFVLGEKFRKIILLFLLIFCIDFFRL